MSNIQLTKDGLSNNFNDEQISERVKYLRDTNDNSDKSSGDKELYNSQLDDAIKKIDQTTGALGDGNLYFEKKDYTAGTGGRDLIDSLFNQNKDNNQAGDVINEEDNIEFQTYLNTNKEARDAAAKAKTDADAATTKAKEDELIAETPVDGEEYSPNDIANAKAMGLELIPGHWKNQHKYLARNTKSNRVVLFDEFTDKGPLVKVLNKKDSEYLGNITGSTHQVEESGLLSDLPYLLLNNDDKEDEIARLKESYLTADTDEKREAIKEQMAQSQALGNNNKFLFNNTYGDEDYGKILYVDKSGKVNSGNMSNFENETGDFGDLDLQHLASTMAGNYSKNIYDINGLQMFDSNSIFGLDSNDPNKRFIKGSNFFTNAYDPNFNYSKILIQSNKDENPFDNFGQLNKNEFTAKLYDKKNSKYITKNFRNTNGEYISEDGTINLGKQTTNAGLLNDQYNSYEFLTHDYRTDKEFDMNPYHRTGEMDYMSEHILRGLDEADIDIKNDDAIIKGIIDLSENNTGLKGTLVYGEHQTSKKFADKLSGLSIGLLSKLKNSPDTMLKLQKYASEAKLDLNTILTKLKLLSERNYKGYIKLGNPKAMSASFNKNTSDGYHGIGGLSSDYSINDLKLFGVNKSHSTPVNSTLAYKNGGILKAFSGASLDAINADNAETKREEYVSGVDPSKTRTHAEGETGLSTAFKYMAMATDAVGAVASFVPVAGTAVELITGLASTAFNIAGNLTDEDGTTFNGDDWAQVGMDLGFTALGIIPGMKMAKMGKAAAESAHVLKATKILDASTKTLEFATDTVKSQKVFAKTFGEGVAGKMAEAAAKKAKVGLKALGKAKEALTSGTASQVVVDKLNDFKALDGLTKIFGGGAVAKYAIKGAKATGKTINAGLHVAGLAGAVQGTYNIYDDVSSNDYVNPEDVQKIFYGAISAGAIRTKLLNHGFNKSIDELTEIVKTKNAPKKYAEFITQDEAVSKNFKFEIDDPTMSNKDIRKIGKKHLDTKLTEIESNISKTNSDIEEQVNTIESLKKTIVPEEELKAANEVLESHKVKLNDLNNQLKEIQVFNKNLGNRLKNKVTLNYIKEAKIDPLNQARVFSDKLDLDEMTLGGKPLTTVQRNAVGRLKEAGFGENIEATKLRRTDGDIEIYNSKNKKANRKELYDNLESEFKNNEIEYANLLNEFEKGSKEYRILNRLLNGPMKALPEAEVKKVLSLAPADINEPEILKKIERVRDIEKKSEELRKEMQSIKDIEIEDANLELKFKNDKIAKKKRVENIRGKLKEKGLRRRIGELYPPTNSGNKTIYSENIGGSAKEANSVNRYLAKKDNYVRRASNVFYDLTDVLDNIGNQAKNIDRARHANINNPIQGTLFKLGGNIQKLKLGDPIGNMNPKSGFNIDNFYGTLQGTDNTWQDYNNLENKHYVSARNHGNRMNSNIGAESDPLTKSLQGEYSDYFGNISDNNATNYSGYNSRFGSANNAFTAKGFKTGIGYDGIFGRQTTGMSPGNVTLQSDADKSIYNSPEFLARNKAYNESLKGKTKKDAKGDYYVQYELDENGNYRYKRYDSDFKYPEQSFEPEEKMVDDSAILNPIKSNNVVTNTPLNTNPLTATQDPNRTNVSNAGTVFEAPDKVNYHYNPTSDLLRDYIGKRGLTDSANILAKSLVPTLRSNVSPTKELNDNYSVINNMGGSDKLLNQQARNVGNSSDANLQAAVNAQYDSSNRSYNNQANAQKAQYVNQSRQQQAAQAAQNDARSAQVQDANMAAIGQTRGKLGQIFAGLAKEKSAINMQGLETIKEGIDNAENNERITNQNLLRSYVGQKSNEAQVEASKYVNQERSRVLSGLRDRYQQFLLKHPEDKLTYKDYISRQQIKDSNGNLLSVTEYLNRLPSNALNNLQVKLNKLNEYKLDVRPYDYAGDVYNSNKRYYTSDYSVGAARQKFKLGGKVNMYKILTNK